MKMISKLAIGTSTAVFLMAGPFITALGSPRMIKASAGKSTREPSSVDNLRRVSSDCGNVTQEAKDMRLFKLALAQSIAKSNAISDAKVVQEDSRCSGQGALLLEGTRFVGAVSTSTLNEDLTPDGSKYLVKGVDGSGKLGGVRTNSGTTLEFHFRCLVSPGPIVRNCKVTAEVSGD